MRILFFVLLMIVSKLMFSQTGDSSGAIVHISEKMDIKATVIGGDKDWIKYLETNMNFMVPYDNGAPIGKYPVEIQFIVDTNGNVSDVKALTNFGYGMEEEGIRLIKGPKWIPATEKGAFIKAYRKQQITFVVLGDGVEISSEEPYTLFTAIENIITVNAYKLNDKDIDVRISQGSIVSIGNGKYKALVNNSGSAILTIFSFDRKKKLGSAYFFVKSGKLTKG